MQQCYDFAGRYKGTIIGIKQVLNSTGSVVGIAWVTVAWGAMVCIRVGHADGGDSFPSDIPACQTAHCHIPNMGSLYSRSARISYRISSSLQECDAMLLGEQFPALRRTIVSLSSRSGRPRTLVVPSYYSVLAGQGDQILNSHVDISHPCAQCITLML